MNGDLPVVTDKQTATNHNNLITKEMQIYLVVDVTKLIIFVLFSILTSSDDIDDSMGDLLV